MTHVLFEYTKIVPKTQTSTLNLFYIYSKFLVASADHVAIFSDIKIRSLDTFKCGMKMQKY